MLCLAATTGCLPLAVAGAAGLIDGGGDGPHLGNTQPYGGPATSPQNGRPDPTIADALRVSDTEISDSCREALDGITTGNGAQHGGDGARPPPDAVATSNPAHCETRPVCLPGFQNPVQMRLCGMPAARPPD